MSTEVETRQFEYDDIGSEILSYLAAGLYPDARDPIREYIQNAVDAEATEVALTIVDDTVIIENNGNGMNADDLWDSLKIAISIKDPDVNVGYKGIGIYSGLLVSKQMVFKSRKNGVCTQMSVCFEKMRDLMKLEESLPNIINNTADVRLIDNFSFNDEAIQGEGTQVTLTGIRGEVISLYNQDNLSKYLRNTLPLPFSPDFHYGESIQKRILEISQEAGYVERNVNLYLNLGGNRNALYRSDQLSESNLLEPHYEQVNVEVDGNETLFAVVWGCLNRRRKVIKKGKDRGFLLKQKGFTIGSSATAQQYFPAGVKHANRYFGEILILTRHIKVKTARDGIAITEHSLQFEESLKRTTKKFVKISNNHQQSTKALEHCQEVKSEFEKLKSTPTDQGLSSIEAEIQKLENRLRYSGLSDKATESINQLLEELKTGIRAIKNVLAKKNGKKSAESSDETSNNNGSSTAGGDKNGQQDKKKQSKYEKDEKRSLGLLKNDEVVKILDELNMDGDRAPAQARKLKQLYESLCKLPINTNSLLAYVGTWALWEIIGAISRENPKQKAWNYLESEMRSQYQSHDIENYRSMKSSLEHIKQEGNLNKHSATGFAENADLLRNKMEVLDEYFLHLIKIIQNKLTHTNSDF